VKEFAGPVFQALARAIDSTEKRHTESSQQDHDIRRLKLQQEHERSMQWDRLQSEIQQKRNVRTERMAYVIIGLVVFLIFSIFVAISSGYLDAKAAGTAVGVAVGAAGSMFVSAALKGATSQKNQPPAQAPASNP